MIAIIYTRGTEGAVSRRPHYQDARLPPPRDWTTTDDAPA